MDAPSSQVPAWPEPTPRDALHVQVAAVGAQQVAVIEQEIRLAEEQDAWQDEREAILSEVERLVLRLHTEEGELRRRETRLRTGEGKLDQLARTVSWLQGQVAEHSSRLVQERQLLIDLVRSSNTTEDHLAQIRNVLDRIQRSLDVDSSLAQPLARAA